MGPALTTTAYYRDSNSKHLNCTNIYNINCIIIYDTGLSPEIKNRAGGIFKKCAVSDVNE